MSLELASKVGSTTWGRIDESALSSAGQKWMDRLEKGDLSGSVTPLSCFVPLRGQKLAANPRLSNEYVAKCLDTLGLRAKVDVERYGHLDSCSVELLKRVSARGTSSMWLPDSPRTRALGFKHRLITKGPPVKVPLHRLSRVDTEWMEQAIKEDVVRGQLVRGSSPWGFPAFPTKESAAHRAVQRGRRIVVDYRALNRVTIRKTYIIPNSDELKGSVAGSDELSVGDLKEGFNQCDNEPETALKLAVSVPSGQYLPQGFTFGLQMALRTFRNWSSLCFRGACTRSGFSFLMI